MNGTGEYISREAVLALVKDICVLTKWDTEYRHRSIEPLDVKELPSADVRPVVRATFQLWEQDKPPCKWYSCDYCGFHALSKSNYCPNCGAAMREES